MWWEWWEEGFSADWVPHSTHSRESNDLIKTQLRGNETAAVTSWRIVALKPMKSVSSCCSASECDSKMVRIRNRQ